MLNSRFELLACHYDEIRVCLKCGNTVLTRKDGKIYCSCHRSGLPMPEPNDPRVIKYALGKILNENHDT